MLARRIGVLALPANKVLTPALVVNASALDGIVWIERPCAIATPPATALACRAWSSGATRLRLQPRLISIAMVLAKLLLNEISQ